MNIKRYKHTWLNGMLEDPKGIWIKETDVTNLLQWWIDRKKLYENLYYDSYNEEVSQRGIIKILTALLFISTLGNLGQLIHHFM